MKVFQAIFVQVGENVVSRKLNFQLGYKLTLWCIGLGEHARKRAREHDESDDGAGASDTEASTSCSKKKKTATEERESRVVELKKKTSGEGITKVLIIHQQVVVLVVGQVILKKLSQMQ